MRCYICDTEDDSITFDRETSSFSPCGVCQEVIFDCLVGYDEEESDVPD